MTTEIPNPALPDPGIDPLLTAARVLLCVLLAGLGIAAVAAVVGLAAQVAAGDLPWGRSLRDPAWQVVTDTLFTLAALWLVADSVLAVLAMIGAVSRGEAFEPANVARLEQIAWNTIGLAILGVIAWVLSSGIGGDINGFEIGIDLPASVGFALLLFILARVFRQGAAMRADLEGTV